ncbi:MAG: hypothetical protein ACTSV6_02095 [Candidatus Heimdallarchaeota archaeon]
MKGQAAMEFLMTYGWAILIVIAVVAALYAMGVFRLPSGGLGKCSPCFPAGSAVAYVDHNADTLAVKVGPNSINITALYVGGSAYTTGITPAPPHEPGTTVNIPAAGALSGDVDVTVGYVDNDSGLAHNVSATLHGA